MNPKIFIIIFVVIIAVAIVLVILQIKRFDMRNIQRIKNIQHLDQYKIVAGMATIPSRSKNLHKVINSIIDQIDHLYVHLNYDVDNEIPQVLYNSKITITHSKDDGDLGASGKFFGILKHMKSVYTITIDDDIIYPENYVTTMVTTSNKYNDMAIITFHGGILPKHVKSYKDERNLIHFNDTNTKDTFANLPGTGVSLYPPGLLNLHLYDFKRPNAADLFLAIVAQKQRIPIIILKHDRDLFKTIPYEYNLWSIEIKNNSYVSQLNTKDAKKVRWTVYTNYINGSLICSTLYY